MGTVELQIFISLIVVLAAAFIALVCDFLKGRNEQLREQNIELRARSEERLRQLEFYQSVHRYERAAAPPTAREALPAMAGKVPLVAIRPVDAPRPSPILAADPLFVEGVKPAAGPLAGLTPEALSAEAGLQPVALEWQKHGDETPRWELAPKPRSEAPVSFLPPMPALYEQPVSEPEPVPDAIRIRVIDEDAVLPESETLWAQPPEAPDLAQILEWNPGMPVPLALPAARIRFSEVRAMVTPPALAVPSAKLSLLPPETVDIKEPPKPASKGIVVEMRPPEVASGAARGAELFEGLVSTVCLLDYPALAEKLPEAALAELLASLENTLRGLLGPQDALSRSGEDEFTLQFPGLTGPKVQRRLATLSERLWDLQLRTLGTTSVFFSWGAVEGQSEPMSALVKAAREQMIDMRRTRKSAIQITDRSRRRTVNE